MQDRFADALAMTLGVFFALYLRYLFRDHYTPDFTHYTGIWYETVRQAGILAIGSDVSNYTPPYLYLLYLASLAFPEFDPVVAIKLPSVAFDFACAWFVYLIVRLKYPEGRAPLAAFMLVILAPTVIANGGVWGQADSIYTSMLLASVYCLMTGRSRLAVAAFSLALSFKLQAMFLAPALAALCMRRIIPLWAATIVPVVYAVAMLPAWVIGRPARELATVYLSQASTYHELTMGAPSLYAWLPQSEYQTLVVAGLFLMAGIGCIYVWKIWRNGADLNGAVILQICMLSLVMTPFFMPKMHDRFFFPADVLAIAYVFFFPRLFLVPVCIGFASFFAYQPYLYGREIIALPMLSLVMFVGLCIVAWHLRQVLDQAAHGHERQ
jgi:Gpi18-like mannosyltransferase